MILELVLLDMKLVSIGFTKPALSTCLIAWVFLLMGVSATAANIGDMAPDFQVTTQNGSTFQLSDFRGQKPVYVVFWNSWCSYCIKKTPRYQKLQEQFGDKIEIIAINTTWSDTPQEMRSFEERYQINYATAFDTDEVVTDRFEVIKVPTEFIIDTRGVIRYRDGVPEYVAAHLPDWLLPYIPSEDTAKFACKK